MDIKNEQPVTAAVVKKVLLKREKEKELGYEQKLTLDHLKKFCELSEKAAEELIEELKEVEKLNERQLVNIVNLLPQDLDELRLIFANERIDLSEGDKKKILDAVKKATK